MKKIFIICCAILTLSSARAQNQNHCVQQLLFDDFNNSSAWVPVPTTGNTTSINGGNFNFNNTPGAGYNRQYQPVPNLSTNSQTIFARIKLFVNSGNAPGHHILTLYENGSFDPVSFDASGGYAPTVNDAIIVDLTAQYGPSTATSNPSPTDPTNLWQFNLRYKQGMNLVTCPTRINLPALKTPYYIQLERGGNTLKLSIFSDPGYTTHIPGSPICFPITGTLNPLSFVNLGVYTWASAFRILNAQLDSLSICSGTDLVVCNPPCDTSCHLTLKSGGTSGESFSCGKTLKLKCNKKYNLNPSLSCTGGSVTGASLTDNFNNTPFWATTFLSNNGIGMLSIPGGIPPGNYTLTYYFGKGGNTCDSCKFTLKIDCQCNCTLSTAVNINGIKTNLQCGDTASLKCKTKYKFTRTLKCRGDSITHVTAIHVYDATGNTPTWANSFITNLGNGILNVPNNVSGIYSLTYYWGSNGSTCDSCTYYLKINCCGNCSFSLDVDGGAIANIHPKCGDTIKGMQCSFHYYFTPHLTCDSASSNSVITSVSIKDAFNNTPAWAVGFTGTGNLIIPTGVSGVYTLSYSWGSNGVACDSCKYYLNITCCDASCKLSGTIRPPRSRVPQPYNCGDTAFVSCNNSYDIVQSLKCNVDTSTHLVSMTLTDPSGGIPSWAATFMTNLGNGTLAIPTGISSGIYTLTYKWGTNGLLCDSCKMYFKITCCASLYGSAGQDIAACCGGAQFNAVASGGIAPYTYSWTPSTGLSNANIANPICTLSGTYTVTIKDAYGCTITDQAVATIATGSGSCCRNTTAKESTTTAVTVSPNPTTNSFKIAGLKNKTASLDIFNFQGVKVEHHQLVNDGNSFGAKLPKGIYMLHFHFKDGTTQSLQLIKN